MANSLTVISECLPAPGQNSPYFARLRVWSCPAVAVIVGRKASCLRGSVCASVRRRDRSSVADGQRRHHMPGLRTQGFTPIYGHVFALATTHHVGETQVRVG